MLERVPAKNLGWLHNTNTLEINCLALYDSHVSRHECQVLCNALNITHYSAQYLLMRKARQAQQSIVKGMEGRGGGGMHLSAEAIHELLQPLVEVCRIEAIEQLIARLLPCNEYSCSSGGIRS